MANNNYYSRSYLQHLDAKATKRYGIPAVILMENAALQFVRCLQKKYPDISRKKILIIAGLGNNGGDGFAIARHLKLMGASIEIYCTSAKNAYRDAALQNYIICRKMKLPIHTGIRKLASLIQISDIIIDALFGIGLSRAITGTMHDIISMINTSKKIIWAVDIPSGLNADKGIPMGLSVYAHTTISFHGLKKGFRNKKAKKYTGRVVVVPISLVELMG